MTDKASEYNDRELDEGGGDVLPKPQIEIIVDGNQVFKPGMKTYFVEDDTDGSGEFDGVITGTYCTCDTVAVTHTICTCEHVCTCESVCSCVAYTAPSSSGSSSLCTCQSVSCGSPCACVPVH